MNTWLLDSARQIGGYHTSKIGHPKIIRTENGGKCIEFDGKVDAFLVDTNPVADAEEFSIEVVFKPYDAFPGNVEQRFLHIQDPKNGNRRILIELRLNDKKQWYADFFICADKNSLSLIDSAKTHPVDEWTTIKLVYKNGFMEGYVNGLKESSGKIDYLPLDKSSKVSIGTRMNRQSWFKGAISKITFNNEDINL